ncbi:MAG: hypothetical protein KDD60_10815, partial [Bdellovibrionales bacterium]|nr:hypothetical protein [Bdellovibrionales bacterium]
MNLTCRLALSPMRLFEKSFNCLSLSGRFCFCTLATLGLLTLPTSGSCAPLLSWDDGDLAFVVSSVDSSVEEQSISDNPKSLKEESIKSDRELTLQLSGTPLESSSIRHRSSFRRTSPHNTALTATSIRLSKYLTNSPANLHATLGDVNIDIVVLADKTSDSTTLEVSFSSTHSQDQAPTTITEWDSERKALTVSFPKSETQTAQTSPKNSQDTKLQKNTVALSGRTSDTVRASYLPETQDQALPAPPSANDKAQSSTPGGNVIILDGRRLHKRPTHIRSEFESRIERLSSPVVIASRRESRVIEEDDSQTLRKISFNPNLSFQFSQ